MTPKDLGGCYRKNGGSHGEQHGKHTGDWDYVAPTFDVSGSQNWDPKGPWGYIANTGITRIL